MKKETQEDSIRRLIAESQRIGREQDQRDRKMGLRGPGIDWSWPKDLPHPLMLLGVFALLCIFYEIARELPRFLGF
jgi:hypothetical protein